MRIDILTLFPELFEPLLATSIIGRAIAAGVVEVAVTNIRDYSTDRHRKVDDAPFGGGPGMVMMCQPVFDAVEAVRAQADVPGVVALLTPQGRRLDQRMLTELACLDRLILVAGHYEGFDERIRERLADVEISLGDFVLSGGEVPAMAVLDGVVRLLPGALGEPESVKEESFSMGLLEYPQYTRPREFRGMDVPEVLLSGHHAEINAWRHRQAIERTMQRRPDLYRTYQQKNNPPSDEPDERLRRQGELS
ncbi:MAG TPA: tRNA (guanosine(37)-N1)-methyltransferase TrmD [Phycisphaerae bacterium]|nr:tRNA (guanosine(37)-N1)-methyltransferase TrmD [Phycisphaerae bacterium]